MNFVEINNKILYRNNYIINIMIILYVINCFILLISRIIYNISFSEPLHLFTSGLEEEVLLSIWESMNNNNIFTDHTQFPYRRAMYNWLFYDYYSYILDKILKLSNITEMWIPTICRLITFLCTPILFLYTLKLLKMLSKDKILVFGIAIMITYGPLTGYWVITTRPDIYALLFEIAAIYIFFKYIDNINYFKLFIISIILYLAWSFKQTNITTLLSIFTYFIVKKDIKHIIFMFFMMSIMILMTFYILGIEYLQSVTFYNYYVHRSVSHVFLYFFKFIIKTMPINILVLFCIFKYIQNKKTNILINLSNQMYFAIIGILYSIVILLSTVTHIGSADNYYFVFTVYLSIFTLILYSSVDCKHKKISSIFNFTGWFLAFISILFPMINLHGSINLPKYNMQIKTLNECKIHIDQPFFTSNPYFSLPWIIKSEYPIILTHNYSYDRSVNIPLENDGIRGLIKQKYFKTLLFDAIPMSGPPTEYDQASLDGYEYKKDLCEQFYIFK